MNSQDGYYKLARAVLRSDKYDTHVLLYDPEGNTNLILVDTEVDFGIIGLVIVGFTFLDQQYWSVTHRESGLKIGPEGRGEAGGGLVERWADLLYVIVGSADFTRSAPALDRDTALRRTVQRLASYYKREEYLILFDTPSCLWSIIMLW